MPVGVYYCVEMKEYRLIKDIYVFAGKLCGEWGYDFDPESIE